MSIAQFWLYLGAVFFAFAGLCLVAEWLDRKHGTGSEW